MTPDARPAGGRRINELMGPNWWRTEAILAARLRDLVAGLDSIGAFTIPYARLPRRLATYADEFPRWQTSLTKPHRHCCWSRSWAPQPLRR
jgi:hypothetical protein